MRPIGEHLTEISRLVKVAKCHIWSSVGGLEGRAVCVYMLIHMGRGVQVARDRRLGRAVVMRGWGGGQGHHRTCAGTAHQVAVVSGVRPDESQSSRTHSIHSPGDPGGPREAALPTKGCTGRPGGRPSAPGAGVPPPHYSVDDMKR